MGIFSSVTGFLGKIADGIAQTIIPGCEWKPSSLLKQVDSLLPIISNAIPGVGPFLSHAVPAIQSIFGGSVKAKNDDGTMALIAKLPTREDIEHMLEGSLKAISETRTALEEKLNAIGNIIIKENELKAYDDFKGKIYPAIVFLKESMPHLESFLPYGGNDQIKNYITKERNHDKTFQLHHHDLNKAIDQLEVHLLDHSPVTQQMLDLYLLGAIWLLTYDKLVMQLRSYLAQHYLVNNAITDYTTSLLSWNQDYIDMRRNARTRATFLLGNPDSSDSPGLIEIERKKRLESITSAEFTSVSTNPEDASKGFIIWADHYPRHGIGHAGTHSGSQLAILSKTDSKVEVVDIPTKEVELYRNSCIQAGYVSVNMAYFDISVKAAVEVAESWRASLSIWGSRLPLSPPTRGENLVKGAVNSQLGEAERYNEKDNGETIGLGWKKGQTICYAVSYVTTHGEGFLSTWSDPPITIKTDDEFIKLTVEPVKFSTDVFTEYKKRENPHAVELNVIRRVYVKMTFNDETRTFFVGTLHGKADEAMYLWDQAEHHRPRPT